MTATYRTLTLTGAGAVTAATLIVSSVHLYAVSMAAGAGLLSFLTPVAVDGLALVAAVSLWAARKNGEQVSGSAVLALVLSLAASIGGNLLYPFLGELTVSEVQTLSAVVAVYPAIALAVSIELVLAAIRQDSPEPGREVTEQESITVTEVHEPAMPVDPMSLLRQALAETPEATSAVLSERVGRSASWVRTRRKELREAV